MFNQDEIKLMHSPGMERFPLVKAAASMYHECQACRAHRGNPKSALVMAINRYRSDKAFISKVLDIFGHPVYLGGSIIGD